MATGVAPTAVLSGGNHLKPCQLSSPKSSSFVNTPTLRVQRNLFRHSTQHNLTVRADYSDHRAGGGGGDFVAGFVLGGAVFGTLAYVFAPQIRKSLLNEDEYGFRRAKGPIYYDEGLEKTGFNRFLPIDEMQKTRQTLNEKISQLNSAIDYVSSRLRGGNNMPPVTTETDPEEVTM